MRRKNFYLTSLLVRAGRPGFSSQKEQLPPRLAADSIWGRRALEQHPIKWNYLIGSSCSPKQKAGIVIYAALGVAAATGSISDAGKFYCRNAVRTILLGGDGREFRNMFRQQGGDRHDHGYLIIDEDRRMNVGQLAHKESLVVVGCTGASCSPISAEVTGRYACRDMARIEGNQFRKTGALLMYRPVLILACVYSGALAAQNVRRLVCITGMSAGDSRGHGGFFSDRLFLPLMLRNVYEDKDRQEDAIRASTLDWTIVRPTVLNDKPARGRIRALTDLSGVNGRTIARADVANFAVQQLDAATWLHKAPLITWQDSR